MKDVETLAGRILRLKIWDDGDGGRWKKSVLDMNYQILLVSQFTLLANTKKGNKPDFHGACPPHLAKDMYLALLDKTRKLYTKEKKLDKDEGAEWVQDGVFGAMMQVSLVNDGPVTFEINTPAKQLVETIQKGASKSTLKGAPKGMSKGMPGGADTPSTEDIAAKVEKV
ncbi:D-Tyr tRNAtyr deacylase-like domain-containing protein [Trichophaea hybrida]|nr:D-Tyr tRNAtyr deacylase-like domain-containing protein [Trichophaea hybrida]